MTPAFRSLKTKETYGRALAQLRNALGVPDGDMTFLKDSARVIAWVEGLERSLNTRKVYYIAIVSHLKGIPEYAVVYDDYKAKMDQYNRAVSDQMAKQELTPRESDKFLTWPEVLDVRERVRLAATDLFSHQDYVILCLYTMVAPVRCDYAPMAVVGEETSKKGNQLLVLPSGMTIVLNEFKTAHKYGQQRIPVPADLEAVLRDWLDLNPSGWLLCDSDGNPMTDAALSTRIISIFKKHAQKAVGVNILRHSYVSWVRRNEPTFMAQQALAAAMCHSVSMSVLYRRLQ